MEENAAPPFPERIELWRRVLTRHKFKILLLALLLVVVLDPCIHGAHIGRRTLDSLFVVLLAAAVLAMTDHRRLLLASLALALPGIALIWVAYLIAAQPLATIHIVTLVRFGLHSGLLVLTGAAVLADVVSAGRINSDKICGAICVYMIIGAAWAILYMAIELVQPGAFVDSAAAASGAHPDPIDDWGKYLYYSYVTLTTLGYGDITVSGGPARTFSWLEAFVGQLYLTILVARLVGLNIAQSSNPS